MLPGFDMAPFSASWADQTQTLEVLRFLTDPVAIFGNK